MGTHVHTGGPDIKILHHLGGVLAGSAAVDPETKFDERLLGLMPEHIVFPYRRREQEASSMAILRYVPDPQFTYPPHRPFGDVLAGKVNGSRGYRRDTEDGLNQLSLSVAFYSGHAENLPLMEGETDAPQPGILLLVHGVQVTHFQDHFVGHGGFSGRGRRKLRANHEFCQIMSSDVLGLDRGDRFPPPQHGYGVRDLEHLVQLVVDEDYGFALGLEVTHVAEELLDLLWHQHRGGLIEDQDLGAAKQRLDDFHSLTLTNLERFGQVVGIDGQPVGLPHLLEMVTSLLKVDQTAVGRLGPQDHVFQHSQIVGQHKVLVYHPNPRRDGVFGR